MGKTTSNILAITAICYPFWLKRWKYVYKFALNFHKQATLPIKSDESLKRQRRFPIHDIKECERKYGVKRSTAMWIFHHRIFQQDFQLVCIMTNVLHALTRDRKELFPLNYRTTYLLSHATNNCKIYEDSLETLYRFWAKKYLFAENYFPDFLAKRRDKYSAFPALFVDLFSWLKNAAVCWL